MPKQDQPQSVTQLLASNSSAKLGILTVKTQHLQILNHSLHRTIGVELAPKCQVVNYQHGILVIQTVNAMFATRLNFMTSKILLNFRRDVLPDLIDIKIKVLPSEKKGAFRHDSQDGTRAFAARLSKQAAESILSVSQSAPEQLKQGLERLAALANARSETD